MLIKILYDFERNIIFNDNKVNNVFELYLKLETISSIEPNRY